MENDNPSYAYCKPSRTPKKMRRLFFAAGSLLPMLMGVFSISAHAGITEAEAAEQITHILTENGFTGGLLVLAGRDETTLPVALAAAETWVVQTLDVGAPQKVAQTRDTAWSIDADGRLTWRHWSGGVLPYTDNLVNALVWRQSAGAPDMTEILRVLAPNGLALIEQENGWQQQRNPWPGAMDVWTHFRYDAGGGAMSRDTLVGPPGRLQWEAGPRFMRSHEIESGLSCLVSDGGRIYYVLDEGPLGITDARFPAQWSLYCRDAFNGILLWKRPMPDWGWQHWSDSERVNDPNTWMGLRTKVADVERLMAVAGDTLYITLGFGAAVSAVNGATGDILRTYENTIGAAEFVYHKGMLLIRREGPEPIMAVCAEDGETLWTREEGVCLGRSLVALNDRVYYHTRDSLVSVALETGEELWRSTTDIRPSVLVAAPEVVLAVQSAVILAFAADTGAPLWEGPGVQMRGRYPDLFVRDGLVWLGQPGYTGIKALTGEIVHNLNLQNVLESGHHWRCYANRATDSYLVTALRGAEFIDLREDCHTRHNWFRGPCISGMLPANGLLYVPPHQCFCYPAVRMDGFFALAAQQPPDASSMPKTAGQRLIKGPAWGETLETLPPHRDDWPQYRRDALRSGAAVSATPEQPATRWSVALGGRLTPPVAADGRVVVAQKDVGAVHCVSLEEGALLWRTLASGPIDSPPTLHAGRVMFGSRDGWVYCLRATDGALLWRFRAAPDERQAMAHGRLESVWPVHGSVLLFNGLIYCAAGRSGFLDGGIYLYALDPDTGAVVHEGLLEGPWPDISKPSYAFHEDGHRADLLTTDGEYLYMGRTALDATLQEVDSTRINLTGRQRGDKLEYRIMPGMRLVATAGLLNDTFWNRSWWMHARVWPGFHYAQQAPKSGQLLVFDHETTYTVKHYATRNRHSPMLFPGSGYLLFADANDNEPLFYRGKGVPEPIPWEPELPRETRWTIFQDAAVDKGPGFTRAEPALWTAWTDVRVEAMALADDRLIIAGTPDIVPEDDPLAALEGRRGGILRVLASMDGAVLGTVTLDAPPVFDGVIAARNAILLCTKDGLLHCLSDAG